MPKLLALVLGRGDRFLPLLLLADKFVDGASHRLPKTGCVVILT